MATPITFPLINGVRHAWASIEINVAGQIIMGIKSINYSRTRTRVIGYGTSQDPLFKTRGKNEYKCDFEMFLAEFNFLQQILLGQANGGVAAVNTGGAAPAQTAAGYGDVFFSILVTYSESGLDTIQDRIEGNTLDTTDASNSEGADPTVRKVETNPLKIYFNGADDAQFQLAPPPQ
jgi:hypothetical protein